MTLTCYYNPFSDVCNNYFAKFNRLKSAVSARPIRHRLTYRPRILSFARLAIFGVIPWLKLVILVSFVKIFEILEVLVDLIFLCTSPKKYIDHLPEAALFLFAFSSFLKNK